MATTSPLRAMILAAGLGTRLKPLTETTPKALLLIAGRPLITYQIKLLAHYGCQEVVINLHWLGQLIEKELGSGKKYGIKIHYSYEEKILGTGGGILKAAPFFGSAPFVVMNSDILIDVNLQKLMAHHNKNKGAATLVVTPLPDGAPFTPLWNDQKGRLIKIGTTPPTALQKLSPQMFTGVQVLTPQLLKHLPHGRPSCIIRNAMEPALAANQPIFAFPYQGYFCDVGTMERYQTADRDISSGKITLPYL